MTLPARTSPDARARGRFDFLKLDHSKLLRVPAWSSDVSRASVVAPQHDLRRLPKHACADNSTYVRSPRRAIAVSRANARRVSNDLRRFCATVLAPGEPPAVSEVELPVVSGAEPPRARSKLVDEELLSDAWKTSSELLPSPLAGEGPGVRGLPGLKISAHGPRRLAGG